MPTAKPSTVDRNFKIDHARCARARAHLARVLPAAQAGDRDAIKLAAVYAEQVAGIASGHPAGSM